MALISSATLCRLRRTARALLLLLAGAALAWLASAWLSWQPDLMAIQRVQSGMTEAQVAAVFGARPTERTPYQFDGLVRPMPGTPKYWYCDAGIVEVVFDPDGRVLYAH